MKPDATAALVAEYRFDAQGWQSVADEVVDSSGRGLHGRAYATTTVGGLLCRAADLSAATSSDYLQLPHQVLNDLTDFTLMVWIQSTHNNREMIVSAANASQPRELQWLKRDDTRWQPRLRNDADGRINTTDVNDGNWHQLVWTRAGSNNCYYVDGVLQDCNSLNPDALSVDAFVVGQELTNVSGGLRNNRGVRGLLDELYVYDNALTVTEIRQIRDQILLGNNWDGSSRVCDASLRPLADYRFDEPAWTGMADEVVDSGGSGYHGIARGARTSADGLLCRAGDFSATGTEHVSLNAAALNGLGNFTISLWGRTGSTASWQTLLSGANAGMANELVMLLDPSAQFYPGLSITFFNDAAEMPVAAFNDNTWHHFVWRRDTLANESCFFMDGALQGCTTHPSAADNQPLDIAANGLVVGQDQDSVGGGFETSQAWNGLLDELLIFDGALSVAAIQQIYNNQHGGLNWDGSARTCQTTARAEYRFDEQVWSGNAGEVTDSSANALHGTAVSAAPVPGLLCNAADLTAPGTADYISLDHQALNGLVDFSISLWVKSPNTTNKSLISAARNGQANALIFWYNNANSFSGYVDNSPASVSGADVFDDQWHHLVWVRQGVQHCLYTDGSLRGCVSGSGITLDVDAGGLVLGQEQDTLAGGFDASQAMQGLLDELLVFEFALDASVVNSIYQNQLNGLNWDGTARTCPVAAIAGLQVVHDGAGIHCLAEAVRVRAVDAAGTPISNYTQQIILDTTTGRGSWRLQSGSGVLQDATADDGLAVYSFVSADAGEAVFLLDYAEGTPLVDIDVVQAGNSGIRDNDSEGLLAFAPSGFTVTAQVLPDPPPANINNPLPAQVAGRNFALHFSAYGTTPTDDACGVIESYQGDKTLHAWQTLTNPVSGTRLASMDGTAVGADQAGAVPLSVSFTAGQAVVQAKYKDAGRLRLNVLDTTTGPTSLAGATNEFVSRPADLRVSRIIDAAGTANPGALTALGPGFVSAGTPFTVEVDAVDAEGSLTPNFGREMVPERLRITSPVLVLPAAGRNGMMDDGRLGGEDAFNATSVAGRFRNTRVVFDEAGVLQLQASVGDGGYLDSGALIGSLSGPVGRFVAEQFALHNGRVQAACNGFTYMAQPEFGVFYELSAENTAGQRLFNYDAAMLGDSAVADVRLVAEHADTGINLGGRILLADSAAWRNGQYLVAQADAQFSRLTTPDGPYTQTTVGVQVVDSLDQRPLAGVDLNPLGAGDCALAGNCSARSLGTTAVYYGRMLVLPAQGTELADLAISAEAQVFSAGGFIEHSLDDCTIYQAAGVSLSDYAGNLLAEDTAVVGPVSDQALVSGKVNVLAPPLLRAPGLGNEGSARVAFSVADWLRYTWQGGVMQNPSATAVFGSYQGHARIIYWAQDP